jgi:GTP cyclohydrolase II
LDSDLVWSFRKSLTAKVSALVLAILFAAAALAPWLATQNPYDIAQLFLLDSELPPMWAEGGDPRYFLGTDQQARDLYSSILYGLRLSLVVGFASVALAAVLGISLGLLGGFVGGIVDAAIMRVSSAHLRAYRRDSAKLLRITSRAPVPLEGAHDTEFVVFRGGEGMRDQVAVVVGRPDLDKPVLVRLHSACLTGDLFGSLKCDCGDQLRGTVQAMAAAEGGILLYLDQEGRGNGIANKIRAYKLQAEGFDTYEADEALGFGFDQRRFGFAAEMLRQLGVTQVRVLTNNPEKIAALEAAGLDVVADLRSVGRSTAENVRYLATKRDKAGHMIELDGAAAPKTE